MERKLCGYTEYSIREKPCDRCDGKALYCAQFLLEEGIPQSNYIEENLCEDCFRKES